MDDNFLTILFRWLLFLALGFAFYVFFVPFVGRKKKFQYIVMGIYTPLITCVVSLYIWCAAADPGDPGIFKSKKYLNIVESRKHTWLKESKLGENSASSINNANAATARAAPLNEVVVAPTNEIEEERILSSTILLYGFVKVASLCSSVIPEITMKNPPTNKTVKRACFTAVCVRWRYVYLLVRVYKFTSLRRVLVDGVFHGNNEL